MSEQKRRVFIIGTGPLLEKGVRKIGGQCLRTWHFTKPILDTGCEVFLATIPIPNKDSKDEVKDVFRKKEYSGFPYTEFLANNPYVVIPALQKICADFSPDAIVGVNPYPSYLACSLKTFLPIWTDLNGWAMVEGQTKAHLDKNDSILHYFWNMERQICLRADKFSTVSEPQRLALIGELAALGRLNSFTFDYRFAVSIPNAVNELHANHELIPSKKILRGVKVPESAFILLWSGGFNTWTDVDALVRIVGSFLKKDKSRFFVATGGMVEGHDETTYLRFKEAVEKSEWRERCLLEGWIETETMLNYYAESDLGINLDSDNYETQFGARNRITNMLASGLPVITTRGSEITVMMEKAAVGWAIPIGDTEGFIHKLDELAINSFIIKNIRQKARDWATVAFSYHKTTEAVLDWMKAPQIAPDNAERFQKLKRGKSRVDAAITPLEREAVALMENDILSLINDSRDLNIIRSRPFYKFLRRLKGLIR